MCLKIQHNQNKELKCSYNTYKRKVVFYEDLYVYR